MMFSEPTQADLLEKIDDTIDVSSNRIKAALDLESERGLRESMVCWSCGEVVGYDPHYCTPMEGKSPGCEEYAEEKRLDDRDRALDMNQCGEGL